MTIYHDGYGNFWNCPKCSSTSGPGVMLQDSFSTWARYIGPDDALCNTERGYQDDCDCCRVTDGSLTVANTSPDSNCGYNPAYDEMCPEPSPGAYRVIPYLRCVSTVQFRNATPVFAAASTSNRVDSLEKLLIVGNSIVIQWTKNECHPYDLRRYGNEAVVTLNAVFAIRRGDCQPAFRSSHRVSGFKRNLWSIGTDGVFYPWRDMTYVSDMSSEIEYIRSHSDFIAPYDVDDDEEFE